MKKIMALCLVLAAALLLCGCVDAGIDELYSLPKTQEEFQQLQALIENEIAAGSEHSAPTAGLQRSSVQMVDIDGDGTNEAVAFLKNPSSTPTICIYRVINGQYELAMTITGEGSAIGRVEYADLDGDAMSEIIVAWKMSTGIAVVKAYSLHDWASVVMLSVSCTDFRIGDFGDITGAPQSAGKGVVVLNTGDEGGTVDIYFSDRAGEMTQATAPLSASMAIAERFNVSTLSDGAAAVFVEGYYQEEETTCYLTDVLAFSGGELKNITLDPETGNSIAKRTAGTAVYSIDIDGDGGLDVPFSEKVYRQPAVTADYYVYDWFSFTSDGEKSMCASTYHCYSDGWYYVLPEQWREGFTVRREAGKTGERTVVLSTVDEETEIVTDKLTIYTLTDENRDDRAKLPGRFVLVYSETTIYAAALKTESGDAATEKEKNDCVGRFHIIYSEWTTGAV